MELDKRHPDLEILAFPCNQFGGQEPGTDEEIKAFALNKYGAAFPLFSKIDVNGDGTHPLFGWLKESLGGFMGMSFVKWNFSKFLLDRNGVPFKRYAPNESPLSFEADIQELLDRPAGK